MTAPAPRSRRIATIPNAISLLRIALIPVFVALIVDPDTTFAGLVLFAFVAATDWVDGLVARATGQTSELGAVLDPVADRLAVAAALIALVVRDAFPAWAAVVIVARDVALLGAGLVLLRRDVRIEVRYLGKLATFTLMVAVILIAWGTLGYALEHAAFAIGWAAFAIGVVESYAAAVRYAGDARAALATRR